MQSGTGAARERTQGIDAGTIFEKCYRRQEIGQWRVEQPSDESLALGVVDITALFLKFSPEECVSDDSFFSLYTPFARAYGFEDGATIWQILETTDRMPVVELWVGFANSKTRATVWLFVWNAYEINLIIIAACIPTLIPLLEIILNHRIASYFNSYKTNRGGSKFSFHKESFRMRRLNSANNDTESGKDILGIKNSINGNSGELGVVEESEEIRGNENTGRIMSQGKIAVTRQWSVTELKY
ncbi:uncharacterized protein EAF02_001652 [Botrytis sinoallii]|uniref:uncharacterized protein n=1 Tax=Botrytis sinoallii TaxID=1463999 RepID=UPI001902A3D4|nr:uncharacterized protein EAF02_001652 [Botrytis sinoallii]KAF7891327.1 hypothetical protein EAF02_001652 [Botrytis sinoallii]